MTESLLNRVRVVLYEPQDLVNIAAGVRAMKNMGIRDLYLVRPALFDSWRVEGIAHDTSDIVRRVQVHESLADALADCVFVAAFTARNRSAKWAVSTARESAFRLLDRAADGPVAVLFGREDCGLPNEALDRAHLHVTIPTTDHASLNLAQAIIVALYELHLAAGDASRGRKPPRKDAPPAPAEAIERYFADAERSLEAIDFFKTRHRDNILRTLRSLTLRAGPDAREIQLLRAMAIEVVNKQQRFRREIEAELVKRSEDDVAGEAAVDEPA
ncbi:MAG: tRNA (cytidine/uridine-2'-O-)-methyltransferase TrmJ [Gemmatimonadaceae bacterium]|nr:tRNA (cytidine/uridine-2'-O-)-methyltransferase TrmJ [Gemmatimonadaceae bacterium]